MNRLHRAMQLLKVFQTHSAAALPAVRPAMLPVKALTTAVNVKKESGGIGMVGRNKGIL